MPVDALNLLELDGEQAVFAKEHDGPRVTLSRAQWEAANRPVTISATLLLQQAERVG